MECSHVKWHVTRPCWSYGVGCRRWGGFVTHFEQAFPPFSTQSTRQGQLCGIRRICAVLGLFPFRRVDFFSEMLCAITPFLNNTSHETDDEQHDERSLVNQWTDLVWGALFSPLYCAVCHILYDDDRFCIALFSVLEQTHCSLNIYAVGSTAPHPLDNNPPPPPPPLAEEDSCAEILGHF